jgi:hypothetical protein
MCFLHLETCIICDMSNYSNDRHNRLYSVMVSTSDSDSGNLGSIPGTTFCLLFPTPLRAAAPLSQVLLSVPRHHQSIGSYERSV